MQLENMSMTISIDGVNNFKYFISYLSFETGYRENRSANRTITIVDLVLLLKNFDFDKPRRNVIQYFLEQIVIQRITICWIINYIKHRINRCGRSKGILRGKNGIILIRLISFHKLQTLRILREDPAGQVSAAGTVGSAIFQAVIILGLPFIPVPGFHK